MPTSYAISPEGQLFPRFAFLKLTDEFVNCTHHWTSQGLLRKRTDRLTIETASQLISTLKSLGYKQTEVLA